MSNNKKEYTKKKMIIDIIEAVIAIILLVTARYWSKPILNMINNKVSVSNELICDNISEKDISEKAEEYKNNNKNLEIYSFVEFSNDYIVLTDNNIKYKLSYCGDDLNYYIVNSDKVIMYTLKGKLALVVDASNSDKYTSTIDTNNYRVYTINSVNFIYPINNIFEVDEDGFNNYQEFLSTINELLNSIEVIDNN